MDETTKEVMLNIAVAAASIATATGQTSVDEIEKIAEDIASHFSTALKGLHSQHHNVLNVLVETGLFQGQRPN